MMEQIRSQRTIRCKYQKPFILRNNGSTESRCQYPRGRRQNGCGNSRRRKTWRISRSSASRTTIRRKRKLCPKAVKQPSVDDSPRHNSCSRSPIPLQHERNMPFDGRFKNYWRNCWNSIAVRISRFSGPCLTDLRRLKLNSSKT
jgi:hypothetical protein